ncbi:MAG: methyltransferase domain-containing protein [Nanoarchaeota archaeon]
MAKEEVLALSGAKEYCLEDRILVFEAKKFDFERLAYTHKVYELLLKAKPTELMEEIKKVEFQKYYKKSFRARVIKIPSDLKIAYNEKLIGSLIWGKLKKPKVDLQNAKTNFDFIFTKNNVYVCLELCKIDRGNFRERDAKFRPGFHPSTMNAIFARALVNLSRIEENKSLLDPFCGVGAILIEAGILNCKVTGNDIDKYIMLRCKKNLEHYKIKNYVLKNGDALKIKKLKMDAIVTDLPYGRHSSLHGADIQDLYNKFMDKSHELLKNNGRMVIVMPSNIEIKTGGFKVRAEILNRIHKGLTRKIVVLEKSYP